MTNPFKTIELWVSLGVIAVSSGIIIGYELRDKRINEKERKQKQEIVQPYFTSLPINKNYDISITSGDYDGDGDTDLVLCGRDNSGHMDTNLYLFLNDGKGNFYNPREKN